MKNTLFTLLILASTQLCSAQAAKGLDFKDGWAVTKKGDTLRGKFCIENTKTGEQFDKVLYLDASTQKKRYGSEKLTSFSVDGKVYEYLVLTEEEPPFRMERVISGDITMYRGLFKSAESTPQKFIYEQSIILKRKNSNVFYEVFEKGFKKDINSYFKGDDDIIQMIKENGWTSKDIEKIVMAYNAKE
jgi:hypothetical protein